MSPDVWVALTYGVGATLLSCGWAFYDARANWTRREATRSHDEQAGVL